MLRLLEHLLFHSLVELEMALVVVVVDMVTLVNSILDITTLIVMRVQDLEVVAVVIVVGTKVVLNQEMADTKVVLIAHNQVVDIKVVDNLHHEMMTMVDMQSAQDSIMDLAHKVDDHSSLIEILVEGKVVDLLVADRLAEIMMHSLQRYLKF